ncbi:hypothetical protein EMCRGX_G001905 [Ephydatia muelleri]
MEGTGCSKQLSSSRTINASVDEERDLLAAATDASEEHPRVWQTPDMKDVKLIEDELFDFNVPEEYLNISFNPEQEPSPGIQEDWSGVHRSSSRANLDDHHAHNRPGHPSCVSAPHHPVWSSEGEEGGARGKLDLITCMPYTTEGMGSAHLRNDGCLMVFTPSATTTTTTNPKDRHTWEMGGEEGVSPATLRQKAAPTGTTAEAESSDASRPASSCFEGKLHFEEEEEGVEALGTAKTRLPSTSSPCASPDMDADVGHSTPPGASQSDLTIPNSTNAMEHHSRLPTPKKQLKKCSTFDKSPVLCSQLKQLRETRDGHAPSGGWSASRGSSHPSHPSTTTPSLPIARGVDRGVGVARVPPTLDLNESVASSCSSSGSTEPPVGMAMKARTSGHGLKPCLVRSSLPRGVAATAGVSGKLQPPTARPKLLPSKALVKGAPAKPCIADTSTDNPSVLSRVVPSLLKPPASLKSEPKQTGSGDGNCQVPRPPRMLPKPSANQDARSKLATPPKQSKAIPTPRNQVKVPLGVANRTSIRPTKATDVIEMSSSSADVSFSTSIMCVATPSVKQSTPAKSSRPFPITAAEGLELIATPTSTPVKGTGVVGMSLSLRSEGDQAPPSAVAVGDTDRGEGGQTPGSARKRRSFIPTPGGRAHLGEAGSPDRPAVPTYGKVMPNKLQLNPRSKLGLLKPRNGRMFGQTRQPEGPMKAEHLLSGSDQDTEGGDGGCGLQSRVKVVHSPLNKENCPKTPHSQWSPVRRKPVMTGEEFIQCTKRTLK